MPGENMKSKEFVAKKAWGKDFSQLSSGLDNVWKSKFTPHKKNPMTTDKDTGYQTPIAKIISQVLNPEILSFLSKNEGVRNEVKQEIFENIAILESERVNNHPYSAEEKALISWKEKAHDTFLRDSSKFVKSLKSFYTKNEFNFEFLNQKLQDLKNEIKQMKIKNRKTNGTETENLGEKILESLALQEEMTNRWDGLLEQKKESWFLAQLENWREGYIKKLYEQIEKYEKLKEMLGPFTNELGRLWDLSEGSWQTTGFEILKHYTDLIEKQPEIAELAEILGRMQEEREELIEELISTTDYESILAIDKMSKEEFVGVKESDDLSHLLSSEVALLGDKTLETLFYAKFLEKKLLTYDLVGYTEKSIETEKEITIEKPKSDKLGPIIICVDTSGSMHGVPEKIAKSLCFAILRIALLEQRKCYLISFSTGIQTIELTDFNRNFELLIRFLQHSFHGGTDPAPALVEAIRKNNEEEYTKADILMISDFIMGNLPKGIKNDIKKSRADNGTKYHSLVISNSSNQTVLDEFDNNWFYQIGSDNPFKLVLKSLENFSITKNKSVKKAEKDSQRIEN